MLPVYSDTILTSVDCACNETGSLNSSAPCDVYNGTCECRPGITSRQCDQCMDMHYNFSSAGCTGKVWFCSVRPSPPDHGKNNIFTGLHMYVDVHLSSLQRGTKVIADCCHQRANRGLI